MSHDSGGLTRAHRAVAGKDTLVVSDIPLAAGVVNVLSQLKPLPFTIIQRRIFSREAGDIFVQTGKPLCRSQLRAWDFVLVLVVPCSVGMVGVYQTGQRQPAKESSVKFMGLDHMIK